MTLKCIYCEAHAGSGKFSTSSKLNCKLMETFEGFCFFFHIKITLFFLQFSEPKVPSTNVLFFLSNSPKPKDVQFYSKVKQRHKSGKVTRER